MRTIEKRIYDLLIELGETEKEAQERIETMKDKSDKELISYETDLGMLVGLE